MRAVSQNPTNSETLRAEMSFILAPTISILGVKNEFGNDNFISTEIDLRDVRFTFSLFVRSIFPGRLPFGTARMENFF